MQVQNWMRPQVITVEEDTPVALVMETLKAHEIRHLPVVRGGRLVGMITDSEVREAAPVQGTTLRAEELHYFLAELKAKDIMKPDPVTVRPDQTMEVAAVKMLKYRVTGLPVVAADRRVVGIISQGDVFRVLTAITGVYHGGIQFAFNLEDRTGSIKEVTDVIREEGGEQIVSILSVTETADEGYRHVFIRVRKMPEERLPGLIKRLEKNFMLLYVVRDPLKDI
jgi:acetoin utilization protein AcuB